MISLWAAFITAAAACVSYSVVLWLIRQRRKCFEAFDGTGIPTVPLRSLINGNSDEYWKPSTIESIGRWLKEYGDVFGFFLGDTPVMVVKDLQMLEEIFLKEQKIFSSRGHLMRLHELQPSFSRTILFSKGDEWRDIRNTISQFFTPSKLKSVMPSLLDAQQEFLVVLGEHADSGVELDINTLCERLTFDAVSKVAFGIDTGVQRNPKQPIFQAALATVPNFMTGCVYNAGPFSIVINKLYSNPMLELANKAVDVIEMRRLNPQMNLPDMAQILLDNALAKRNDGIKKKSGISVERAPLPKDTMAEMAANCMIIFLGGYDTTRLVLTYWFYVMGRHQDVQEKMRREALEAFEREGDALSMQTLFSLQYTNQVINETLRMYPPGVTVVTRGAEEDFQCGKYLIKKGTSVMAPTYQLHHDPQYWNDPENFDPERFSPENKKLIHPIVFHPFGLGRRMCIGYRLALIEILAVTTEVLRHFRISQGGSQKGDNLSMPTLLSLQYRTQIISETRRIYPPGVTFSPENAKLIHPIVYHLFGFGKRMCIGYRPALLEILSVTTQVLRHFRIPLGESQKTKLPRLPRVLRGTWSNDGERNESIGSWLKEYGYVFGFFIGDTAFVVVKDLEMIDETFFKEIKSSLAVGLFHSLQHLMRLHELQPSFRGNILFSKGNEWKHIRNTMAQFFAPTKLKSVMSSLLDGQRQFLEILGEYTDSGAEVDINAISERLTFDVSNAAFGINTGVQRNPQHPLFQVAVGTVPGFMTGFFYNVTQNLFHWLWPVKAFSKVINMIYCNPMLALANKAADVIELRRENPQMNLPDMAQILLNNALAKRKSGIMERATSAVRAPLTKETMAEMVGNCMVIFLGGHDTTRLCFTYLFYVLGRHPDVQEKMRREALDAFAEETLLRLQYTNQVISETLRMHPPFVTMVTRAAEEDFQCGRFLIRKGTSVMAPTHHLHHNPQYWNDPKKFYPDSMFSPENKKFINPIVPHPFVLGRRMCIGYRLALNEILSVSTAVLRHFGITLGPSKKLDVELDTYSVLAVPKQDVWIRMHRLSDIK